MDTNKVNEIMKNIKSADRRFIERTSIKMRAVNLLGCKCKICGMDLKEKYWVADFHHIDPKEKEDNITEMTNNKQWPKILNELNKCILVCMLCHRDIHFNIERAKKYKDVIDYLCNNPNAKLYRRKASSEEIEEARRLFFSGMSYKEISEKVKFMESTLRIWFPKNKLFNFKDPKNENLIIDIYEKQKKTMSEVCKLLHCSSRCLKKKIIELVKGGKISSLRENSSNQYIKNPRKVLINGKTYNNVIEASKDQDIGASTIYYRIKRKVEGYSIIN